MNTQSRNYTRREALCAMGLMALAFHPLSSLAATKKRAMALQLYTLRDPAKKDLADTLKKVREMGWEFVQWSGMPNLTAEQIKAALDTAGLKAIAAHVGIEPFEKDYEANVKFWKTTGVGDIAPGGMMNDCKATSKDWISGAKRLDALGAKLRASGLRLSYHNHAFEFEKFPDDDRRKIDILLETAKPENLSAEFDLAWIYVAGVDPASYVRKYKGRCPVVHAKDVVRAKNGSKQEFKPLGQGEMNWPEIFKAGDEAGIEWYVYEQDSGQGSPFDYAHASYEFLSKQMK
ncbi:MAG: sugar phosphate isomerase/epimerase [Verrucomicrobia bacterium]|nr:sugar phosphate isomerase/epimerase [Verrucomicrobiota bacterium]